MRLPSDMTIPKKWPLDLDQTAQQQLASNNLAIPFWCFRLHNVLGHGAEAIDPHNPFDLHEQPMDQSEVSVPIRDGNVLNTFLSSIGGMNMLRDDLDICFYRIRDEALFMRLVVQFRLG